MTTDHETHQSGSPVRRLVGRMRELVGKSTASGNGWEAESCGNDDWRIKAPHPFAKHCCPDLGCANNVHAIVAAINALPALLAIAEAAEESAIHFESCLDIADHHQGGFPEDFLDEKAALNKLKAALSLPSNAKITGPQPEKTNHE
jgi:hypothetical protein